MKRWNFITGVAERSPRVEQFLDAVLALSREHGLSIAHEDAHGAFAPGGGAVMTRPMATPEPWEASAWWGASRPLRILEELELVARASGRAVEITVTPLTPPPALHTASDQRERPRKACRTD